jgi:hypothetical protein
VRYSFESFRTCIKARVQLLHARQRDPDFVWPGLLILDQANGLNAEAFELGDDADRDYLATRLLPDAIRESDARRFCWVMPAHRDYRGRRLECLLLVIGERDRVEAALADIIRTANRPSRLTAFSDGPFGPAARRVSGRFVESLMEALLDVRLRNR